MLTSDHIDMLLTVIDQGSFSAAARALGRTPSAVSMAIANLEAELDLVLFDRGSREPTPTAAMIALLPDARAIADRLHALRAHAQHLSEGVEDTLRLGLAAELDGAPIARALTAVAAKYPALAISIVTAPQDAIVDALHRGAVDLCVAYGGLDLHPQEQIHALWTETLVAVAAPGHPAIAEAARPEAIERLSGFRQIVIADPDRPLTDVRPVIGNRTWKRDRHRERDRAREGGARLGELAGIRDRQRSRYRRARAARVREHPQRAGVARVSASAETYGARQGRERAGARTAGDSE